MKTIYPLVCQGYCVIQPNYVDKNDLLISVPFANSDDCEGWESTTYILFNGDSKTTVWLCPDCAKRWNEEKQERINNILNLVTKIDYIPKKLGLYVELLALNPTKEQKWEFDKRAIETEREFNIKCKKDMSF